MAAADTGFFFLFLLLVGSLMITNFIQDRTNMKTPYQSYFGLVYLIAFVFLLVAGWSSLTGKGYR